MSMPALMAAGSGKSKPRGSSTSNAKTRRARVRPLRVSPTSVTESCTNPICRSNPRSRQASSAWLLPSLQQQLDLFLVSHAYCCPFGTSCGHQAWSRNVPVLEASACFAGSFLRASALGAQGCTAPSTLSMFPLRKASQPRSRPPDADVAFHNTRFLT